MENNMNNDSIINEIDADSSSYPELDDMIKSDEDTLRTDVNKSGRFYKYADIPMNSEYGQILEFREWIVTILDLITRIKGTNTPFDQNQCNLRDIIGIGDITTKFLSLIEIGDKLSSMESTEAYLSNLITDLDNRIDGLISYRSNIIEPQINTLNDITNEYSETISNIERELEDLREAIDTLSGGNQSSGNTITNIISTLTTVENRIENINIELSRIDDRFNDYVQNGGNATKIICSTSNPSSLDTNPNGTLWLVYLEE